MCPDGSCQLQCRSTTNVCQCPSVKQAQPFNACSNQLTIDIHHYDASQAEQQIHLVCAAALNQSSYPTWTELYQSSQNNAVWNVCKAPASVNFPTQGISLIFFLDFCITLNHRLGTTPYLISIYILIYELLCITYNNYKIISFIIAPTFLSYLFIYVAFYVFLGLWIVYKTAREKVTKKKKKCDFICMLKRS